jgi:CubicO group peptidase (beta-lactamase class C family)
MIGRDDEIYRVLRGLWSGVALDAAGGFRTRTPVEYEFIDTTDGLALVDRGRLTSLKSPAPLRKIGARKVKAIGQRTLWPRDVEITITISDGSDTLDVVIAGDGFAGELTSTVRLSRDETLLADFRVPRRNAGGEVTRSYRYQAPDRIAGDWPTALPQDVGLEPSCLEGLVACISSGSTDHAARRTEAVLVLRHGKLVLEEYFWGTAGGDARPISSCTKSIASLLVGMAVDRGLLDLDEDLASLFPGRPDSRWRREHYPIRLRHLLAMTAGIAWSDKSATDSCSQGLLTATDQTAYMLDLPLADQPGHQFVYNNGLPALLGPLLRERLQEPVETFAERELFAPLGVRNYRWARTPDRSLQLAGGLYMTPREAARVGQFVLNQGRWGNAQIVSRAWMKVSTARQTRPDDYPYGFYWHLSFPERLWRDRNVVPFEPVEHCRAIMAIGQGGQLVVALPDEDIVLVFASANWIPGMPDVYPTDLINRYIIPAIRR